MCQLWVTTCPSCSSSPSPSACLQNVGLLQTPGAGTPYSELIRRGLGCVQGFEVMDVTRSSPEFCADSYKFFLSFLQEDTSTGVDKISVEIIWYSVLAFCVCGLSPPQQWQGLFPWAFLGGRFSPSRSLLAPGMRKVSFICKAWSRGFQQFWGSEERRIPGMYTFLSLLYFCFSGNVMQFGDMFSTSKHQSLGLIVCKNPSFGLCY